MGVSQFPEREEGPSAREGGNLGGVIFELSVKRKSKRRIKEA